jgi:type III secretory pathway component EscS
MYTIVAVTLISFFIYVYKGGRLIGYHLLEILKDLYKTLFAASVAGVVVYLLSEITSIDNRFVLLVIQLIIMVFIYLLLSIILKNPIYTELKEIVKSLFK